MLCAASLGALERKCGQPELAASYLRRALREDPRYLMALNEHAEACTTLGLYAEAKSLRSRAHTQEKKRSRKWGNKSQFRRPAVSRDQNNTSRRASPGVALGYP